MASITGSSTHRYRNFHLWILIPFVISILGFSYSYYSRLSTATFHQHVHGISATLWYILVIIQPYLIARKHNVRLHIIYGTIGLLIAGIVAGSAYTIIPKNIDDVTELKDEDFFNPTFAYFATLIDFLLISMFVICVGAAILSIKKKRLADHVQWIMASVFFVLSPGLARLLGLIIIISRKGNMEGVSLEKLAIPTMIVMLLIIVFYYYKYGSFRHLSFKLLILAHIPYIFVTQIGSNETFQRIVTAIFK
jgi:tellurite resistance protein TehA-like permease